MLQKKSYLSQGSCPRDLSIRRAPPTIVGMYLAFDYVLSTAFQTPHTRTHRLPFEYQSVPRYLREYEETRLP